MNKYITYHDNLTKAYYNNKTFNGQEINKEIFEALHSLNNLKKEKEYPDPVFPMENIDNLIAEAENNLPSGIIYSVNECEVGE